MLLGRSFLAACFATLVVVSAAAQSAEGKPEDEAKKILATTATRIPTGGTNQAGCIVLNCQWRQRARIKISNKLKCNAIARYHKLKRKPS